MLDLNCAGRVALVSGGSRGIGRAIAIMLAEHGAKVSIGYLSRSEAAEATVAEIRSRGGEAIATAADIRTPAGCEALHAATVAALGSVDILVNGAGGQNNGVFMLLSDEQFESQYAEHVMAVVRLSRLAASGMIARRWGRIINFSSVAARDPATGQSNYAAAKGAVESLTISMAVELARRNITVNCLSPGLVDTEMAIGMDIPGYFTRCLVKRLGRPDEVAAWVLMLVSRYGEMMTGQIIGIDGGYRLI